MWNAGLVAVTALALLYGASGCARPHNDDVITCFGDAAEPISAGTQVLASADCFKRYEGEPKQ